MTAAGDSAVVPVALPPRLHRSAQAHPPLPSIPASPKLCTAAPDSPAIDEPHPLRRSNSQCGDAITDTLCPQMVPRTLRAASTESPHESLAYLGHHARDPALPEGELDYVASSAEMGHTSIDEEEDHGSAEEGDTPSSPAVQIWNPFTRRHHAHGPLPANLRLPKPPSLTTCREVTLSLQQPSSPEGFTRRLRSESIVALLPSPPPEGSSPTESQCSPMSPVGSSVHRRVMEGKRKKAALFNCTMEGCTASFTGKHNLRSAFASTLINPIVVCLTSRLDHLNSHLKIRPYKCTKCDSDFGTRSDLNRHLLAKRHKANNKL